MITRYMVLGRRHSDNSEMLYQWSLPNKLYLALFLTLRSNNTPPYRS